MSNTTTEARTGSDQPKRVVISSLVGTTIEWYEFFIYGTAAALVFNKVFFPNYDDVVGTLLALSTFAIAFVARPVGGVIFGHFGDRVGRKTLLVITLSMMGGATFLMGLLPTYESIGVTAPILLIVLRLIQGISLGGEYGGAVLMSVEHASAKRRGFFGAIVNTGAGWGLLLANLVFLALSNLSDEDFQTWGWRIPFLLSAVIVIVGLVIRLTIKESPEFANVKEKGTVQRLPIKTVLVNNPRTVILMALSYLSAGATFYVATVFSIAYATGELDISKSLVLRLVLATTAVTILGIPFFGWLSDKMSRKAIFLLGIMGMAALPWLWFPLFGSNHTGLMFVGFIVLFIPYCANYGTMPTFYAHVFPTEIRYTGLSLGYTLGTVLGSATAPLVATYLLAKTDSWHAIALYMTAVGIVSFFAATLMNELPAAPATDAAGRDSVGMNKHSIEPSHLHAGSSTERND